MKRWIGVSVLFLFAIMLLSAGYLHDLLAITAPSGARAAVVEGWMPRERIPALVQLLVQGGYERIYVTGTTRSFAYYMERGQTLQADLAEPTGGELMVNASGIDGARLVVMVERDTLMDLAVSGSPTEYRCTLPPGSASLTIASTHERQLEQGTRNIFLKEALIHGTNVHTLAARTSWVLVDGTRGPAAPTYAEWGAGLLAGAGIPAEQLVPVPAAGTDAGRTLSNARTFADRAHLDHITMVDLISLGVHARRSQRVYQQACGTGMRVGVRSLADPETPREGWWKRRLGVIRVLKELAGIPAVEVLDASSMP
jgi:hypothetical protein